jgi:repressor of nif and glnA expression
MKKRTIKSAINRSNIKASILKVINEAGKPISTEEIAIILGNSWHTIIRYCLDLQNEEKLTKFEVGRINVWQIKK